MGAPVYREYAPRPDLREHVQCVWTFDAPFDPAPQPIAPDGRCELIVHLGKPYAERGARGDVAQAPVLFAGQLTQPLILAARGDVAVVGVRFRPDGAHAFFGRDVDAATDTRRDLSELHGAAAPRLRRAMRAAPERRVALAQDYVAARLADARVDPVVRGAVTRLLAGKEAGAPAGLSERQFQRRFKAHVGVAPRMFASVLRFRRVFDAIEHPAKPGWVAAALAAGYFDQPQMARDFRRFLGCTARAWAAQKAGLALALTSETYKK